MGEQVYIACNSSIWVELAGGGGLMRFFRIGDLPRPQILCASYKEEGEKGPREDASETIG